MVAEVVQAAVHQVAAPVAVAQVVAVVLAIEDNIEHKNEI